jgi:hypothetical protein
LSWREAWRWNAGQQSSGLGGVLAFSRSSFMDLLLDLALCVVERGWVMGMEFSLRMCFDMDIQLAEGGGLGVRGCGA